MNSLIENFTETRIPVVEIFQSISGEGVSSGNIVTFVRVAGCNLRCSWCDTKYSFNENADDIEQLLPEEIVQRVEALGSNEIICTGGEPLEEGKSKRYLPLYLASHEYSVHIETSGGSNLYSADELESFNIERDEVSYCMDIKCPGSNMEDKNIFKNIPLLEEKDELKFVIASNNDLEYTMKVIEKNKNHLAVENIALNFSPVFGAIEPLEIVEFLKKNTSFFEENELWPRLNLQLHKYVWPPHKRGV